MEFEKEFINQSIFRLNENTPRVEKCLDLLSNQEVWKKTNNNSNSIGNLILHLCGNITQYVISSLGRTKDHRTRDLEFQMKGGFSNAELIQKLQQVVHDATEIIKNLDTHKLTKIRSVQGFQLSGIGIIIHVIEHYSYHTGQITFFTKLLKDKDLGYYADLNLDIKNNID